MDFFWLYDLPTWALFALVIGTVSAIAVSGCLFLRQRFDILLGLSKETNELVGHFLSFTGVFYGIVLGLVAVGAWDTYNEASSRAEAEAARVAAFYRDVSQLPDPYRTELQFEVRNYTSAVIKREWPDQREGKAPSAGDRYMTKIATKLFAVPATTPNIQIIVAEAGRQFNDVVEARRARIQSVDSAIPASLWYVIIAGTLIIIIMTWMLSIENKRLDVVVNLLMAMLMGSVLSFIIAMDNPFRGELSVSSEPFQLIYDRLMEGNLRGG